MLSTSCYCMMAEFISQRPDSITILRHDSSEPGVQSQWTWGSSIAKAVTLDKARATLALILGHPSIREVEIPNLGMSSASAAPLPLWAVHILSSETVLRDSPSPSQSQPRFGYLPQSACQYCMAASARFF